VVSQQKSRVARGPSAKPKGREEVSAAILENARALFASRPYKDVTMREIAEGARVNLGLLHRHFGSKELILKTVMQAYATRHRAVALQSASVPDAVLALFSDASQAPLLRTLANVILADIPVREFIAHDGAFSVMFNQAFKSGKAQEKDLDVLVAFALFMGWSVFENFLVEASERRVTHERLRDKVYKLGNELLSPVVDTVKIAPPKSIRQTSKVRGKPKAR
jgi:TetR/AcrR family transcriptional regulator, repressor for neighboring sulfatase